MSIYGSSPFNIDGYTLTALLSAPGPQGPTGFQGPAGNPGYGPTGATGVGIDFFTYIDNFINTIYEDGSISRSQPVDELPGGYLLEVNGSTSGVFSPLQSIETLYNTQQTYNGVGDNKVFNQIKKLNFKNIKTNSSPFIQLSYQGPTLSETGVSQPGRAINISYNVFNLGTTNVTTGPNGSLVVNNPGNVQTGYTGSTYNISENAANFSTINVAEQLVVIQSRIFSADENNDILVWIIDPDIGSIFYLKNFKDIPIYTPGTLAGYHILIKQPQISSIGKSFTIIFPKEFTTQLPIYYFTYTSVSDIGPSSIGDIKKYRDKFIDNISWQFDSYFCPSSNYDVLNFISIGSRYVAIPASYNTNLNSNANIQNTLPSFPCYSSSVLNQLRRLNSESILGLCCKQNCSCDIEYNLACDGYFYPGITCGGASGPCSNNGACCLFDSGKYLECKEITYCDCATIANQSNLSFVWNPFKSLKTSCADFNCQNAKNNIGACCDGNGICVETTSQECSNAKQYYQGNGVNCTTSNNLNVCGSGSGACCDSGITCENGITGSNCLSEYKTYFGDGTTCDSYVCSANKIPCYSIIENEILYPGKEFDGGIIVGIFNPNGSNCFGTTLFDGSITSFSNLIGITSSQCVEYKSKYDYSGYGFEQLQLCDSDNDSYIMIVSPHPVNLDDNKQLVDGSFNNHLFKWSNGSVAWGPLINITSNTLNEFEINNLSYKEGYIYSSTNELSSKLGLHQNTFLTCSGARYENNPITILENKSPQSITGNWFRNYGLYNTIRLVGSEYFYYNIGISNNGATLENYTPITSDITISRALSVYNLNKLLGTPYTSQWYVPSIDELSYLAYSCSQQSEFNLNSRLVELGYTPITGWHWSSTGAFNLEKNEGILTQSGVTHGSEAWAIKFDIDGNEENMIVSKKSRDEKLNLRPIKLLRCDKKHYTLNDLNFKLWNIPILSEFIIDN